jgi:hypothetical protein
MSIPPSVAWVQCTGIQYRSVYINVQYPDQCREELKVHWPGEITVNSVAMH